MLKGAQATPYWRQRHYVFTCYTAPSGGKYYKFQTQGPWVPGDSQGHITGPTHQWRMSKHTLFRSTCQSWRSRSLFAQFSSVQWLSRVWLFATPWTTARQASLSITNSRSPPKHKSIESVMPSNHLILCGSLLLLPSVFPSIRVFSMSQLFTSGAQSIGVSASTSVLPMNTQDWSPLGWTDWISLQSKGLSWVFSNTTVQKHQFFLLIFLISIVYSFPTKMNCFMYKLILNINNSQWT